jgi:hypothetical protein
MRENKQIFEQKFENYSESRINRQNRENLLEYGIPGGLTPVI